MRLAAQAKGGYYPTPERVVDLIAELIHTPSSYHNRGRETIRILDPCCGGGDALQRLAEGLDRPNALPIETYGVELHQDRAEEAEKRLYRTLASDLFQTSIANGAFGLLLLNPPYDYDSEDKRTEHAFLTHCTRYLAESGLLVFIVPRLWRTVKYEEVYLKAYTNVLEAQRGLEDYFRFYNDLRPHQALGYQTPAEVFRGEQGVVEEESNGMRYSAGTGAELLAGAPGLSLNSALILSK